MTAARATVVDAQAMGAKPTPADFSVRGRARRGPGRTSLRKYLVQIHLWLGLTLGLLWSVQGLTGALLVFHRELDRVADGRLASGPMASAQTLIEGARRAAGRPIQRITAVGSDLRVLEARYADADGHAQALRVEAATGRIVGHRDRDPSTPFGDSAWRWIYLLHDTLLAGDDGETFIGISGLFLLTSLGCGLYIGWPKRRQWRAAFAVGKWRSLPQKFYGWHRALGLSAGAILLIMASTGAYMVFDLSITRSLSRVAPFNPMAAMAHQHQASDEQHIHARIGPDEALARARAVFPTGAFMNLELPEEHPGYYSIRFTLPGEWRTWSGRATVQIDPSSGAVLAVYDPSRAPTLNRVDDLIYPTHLGEVGGVVGRVLVMMAGLCLPVFYVTGVTLWWRKRRARTKSPSRRAEA